jgi:hypothetical protein
MRHLAEGAGVESGHVDEGDHVYCARGRRLDGGWMASEG